MFRTHHGAPRPVVLAAAAAPVIRPGDQVVQMQAVCRDATQDRSPHHILQVVKALVRADQELWLRRCAKITPFMLRVPADRDTQSKVTREDFKTSFESTER